MSPFSARGNPGPRVAAQKGRGFFLTSSSPGMLRGAGTRIPVASSESILVLGRRGVVYDATAGGSGQSDPGTPATRGRARLHVGAGTRPRWPPRVASGAAAAWEIFPYMARYAAPRPATRSGAVSSA